MVKILLTFFLVVVLLFAQPKEAAATAGPDTTTFLNLMFAFASAPHVVLSLGTNAANLYRYTKDPAETRLAGAYLGVIAGSLTILTGVAYLSIPPDQGGFEAWHAGGIAAVGYGALTTVIGIHSVRRIKKARAEKKVSFHGITPTLLGSRKVEGMGFNVSLGW